MTFGRLRLAPLTFCALLVSASAASAGSLNVEYSVSIRGFPVGTALLAAEDADGGYSIEFSARVTGLARLFSDATMSGRAAGRFGPDRPQPDTYDHVWVEDGETENVTMRFAGTSVTDISLDPPRKRPERYVPITDAQTADVLDPVSAFLWPAPGGLTPEICARTLPLIDGKYRFDIDLAFARDETFSPDGTALSYPTIVCSMRYRQIAGHRIGRKGGNFMRADAPAEVWMAAAGSGLVAPVHIELQSRVGRIMLRAKTFEAQ
jgi:hypothetical protein